MLKSIAEYIFRNPLRCHSDIILDSLLTNLKLLNTVMVEE